MTGAQPDLRVAAEALAVRSTRAARPGGVAFAALAAAGLAAFFFLMVKDLRNPVVGAGDLNLWAYQGYYVATNLSLLPVPHLDLVNDQTFYPYGTSQVLQPWGLERELLYAALFNVFGFGPWLQLYFLLSLAITLGGCYLLLRGEEGEVRAGAFAFLVTFGSYAALWRWPDQMGLATLHWVTLGIVADYLLVRRAYEGRPWPGRLVLARVAFLVLALGLSLGYHAGAAIVCFLLAAPVAVALATRHAGRGWRPRGRALLELLTAGATDLRRHPVQTAALSLLLALGLAVYVPLVVQITRVAGELDFSGHPRHYWWVNPVRLLIPIVPGIDYGAVARVIGDEPEGSFGAQPGLFFVIVGVAGAVVGRRRLIVHAPFIAAFALFLALNPLTFRAFNLMPWVAHARVGSRFTALFPIFLLLLGLELARELKGRRRWAIGLPLAALFLFETTTAYSTELRRTPGFVADDEFRSFMAAIRESPGEAVFEWPFCVVGGNGIGTEDLCPFVNQQSGLFALRQFHGKKVTSCYLGRLIRDQLTPFYEANWPALLVPDAPLGRASRQRRDLLEEEWTFLADFVRLNDYAGVVIYPDLLDPDTVAAIHTRVGGPTASSSFPGVGRMEFFRRPEAWRGLQDPARGRALRFGPPRWELVQRIDLLDRASSRFLGAGWSHPEKEFRWTQEREAEIRFLSVPGTRLQIELHSGGCGSQRMEVALNGTRLGEVHLDNITRRFSMIASGDVVREDNLLTFTLPDARRPSNGDPRLLGASFREVVLTAVVPAERD